MRGDAVDAVISHTLAVTRGINVAQSTSSDYHVQYAIVHHVTVLTVATKMHLLKVPQTKNTRYHHRESH